MTSEPTLEPGDWLTRLRQRVPERHRWILRHLLPWSLALAVLSCWVVGIAATGRWPSGDGPHSLGIASRLAGMLRSLELWEFTRAGHSLRAPHPPGAYAPAVVGYTLFGTASSAHLVGGALVLAACWDALRRMGAGLPGAIWLAGLAPVWLEAEGYGIDLVGAACVVQAISHLVASDRLTRPWSVTWWGAWMGAAFLAKYTAPMFLWAPCLVAGWWTLRDRRFRALARALVGFAVVALPWWGLRLRAAVDYIVHSNTAAEEFSHDTFVVEGPWWAWDHLSWYLAVGLDAWGWLGGWAVVLALLSPRVRGALPGTWLVPVLGALGGWFILTTQIVREARYLLPALVLSAVLVGTSRLRWILACVGAVSLSVLAPLYFDDAAVPSDRPGVHVLETAGGHWPTPHESFRPRSMDPGPWRVDETIERLRAAHGRDDGTVGFLIDERGGAPGVRIFLYRTGQLGYRWNLASPSQIPGDDLVLVAPFASDDWPSREYHTLVAMLRPGDGALEALLRRSGLTRLESWSLPGGYEGRLYGRP